MHPAAVRPALPRRALLLGAAAALGGGAAVALTSVWGRANGASAIYSVHGLAAPALDRSAAQFDGQALLGQVTLLNVWATWCAPCAIEMPELQALHEETNIPVLGINIAEPRSVVQQWVSEFDLTFDIALDPQREIYLDYRLVGQPTTYILNPDGIITHIFYGPTTADALQAAIDTHQPNG